MPIPRAVDRINLDPGEAFVEVDTGISHACALTDVGNIYCWGSDNSGQLGLGAASNGRTRTLPERVDRSVLASGSRFTQVVTGNQFSCGLASDNTAYCWGRDANGQLGEDADGDNNNEAGPVPVQLPSP